MEEKLFLNQLKWEKKFEDAHSAYYSPADLPDGVVLSVQKKWVSEMFRLPPKIKSFSFLIKKERLRKGLSQVQVVQKVKEQGLNITQAYISKIEAGKTVNVSVPFMVALARALGVSLMVLLESI